VLLTDRPDVAEGFPVRTRLVDFGPKLSLRTWRSLMVRTPDLQRKLRRTLRDEAPYDVLLVHYKKEQLMAPLLPRALRPSIAWMEWGPVPFPMRKGLPRLAYLAAARRADIVLAISQGTVDSLTDVGVPREKIVFVNNVLRVDDVTYTAQGRARVRRELGIPEDAFVVGALSRFHPKKRNDVLVDALCRLEGEPHLIIGGEGETEAELKSLAAPMGDRAHFVETPGDDVADYLSAFDVLVFCPSPTEGQPRAVILGQLAERPTVSTGAEGVRGLIEPGTGEILSPEHDVDALVASLRGYAADPARREREGRAARAIAAERHAAPVVGAEIESLLEQARSRNRSR
jgi:glycosyltransferase involved in cell wall biosynthesis